MSPRVVIAGAGPAGMMLAYLLASNGVEVRVLEQHPDFEREFRGELLGPSVLPVLDALGVLPILVQRGLARRDVERRMFVGPRRRVTLPMGNELGALVSQPGLLALLDELCRRHPSYTMSLKTTAAGAVREAGRVVALETKSGGVESRVDGDLFVVCNGRNSRIRKDLEVELELAVKPDDTLWLRFDLSDSKDQLPANVDVHMFGGGVVLVMFATAHGKLQIAYSAPGDLGALRKDLAGLRQRVLPLLPERVRAIVGDKIGEGMESQLLKVSIDRLKSWHVPGLLFLGDAAHTMGPAGAQGLNLAIRDSIVAANHILDAIGAGAPIDDALLERIEAERRPEIEAAQAGQLRAYRMVQKPLFVEHLMFTMLGLGMKVKKFGPAVTTPVEPKHAVRASVS